MALTPEQQKALMRDFLSKAKPFVPKAKIEQVVEETVSKSPPPSRPGPVSQTPSPPAPTPIVGPPAPVPDPSPPQPGDPSFVGPPEPRPPQPGDPGFVGPVAFPLWYSKQVRIPESVRFLGLGYQYLRYGYEGTPEQQKSLLKDFLSKAKPFVPKAKVEQVIEDPKSFESIFESRFEQLSPARKFEYGLRFGDIKEVPIGEWKYYEGGAEYIAGLPSKEKEKLVSQYIGEYPEKFDIWSQVKTGFTVAMTHGPMLGIPMFVGSLFGLGESKEQLSQVDTPEGRRRKAWVELHYFPGEIGEQQYERLNIFQQSIYSAQTSLLSASLWPVTLTQTGIKYVTGEGAVTDPLGRIRTGKPLILPDISKVLQETKIGGPAGLIGVGVSEGIGAVTGEGSKEWEKAQRYPIPTIFATAGEVLGLYAGGKGVQLFKVGVGRVTSPIARGIESRLGIPSLSAYRPTALLRKAWWKGKEKLGRAKYIPEEEVWDPKVLQEIIKPRTGKPYKFAELHGAGKQLSLFRRTVTSEGEIIGIHTAAHKLGLITFIKKGTSETPGLSISAYGRGSPHFLRIGGGYGYDPIASRLSLLPQLWRPTAPLFTLKSVFRLPKSVRYSFEKATSYLKGLRRGPYAHIAPKVELGGPEIEAIISKGTFGLRTSKFYYTTYKGVVVPLPTYKLLGSGMPKGAAGISARVPSGLKDFFSLSYQTTPSIPLVSPGYIASIISRPSIPSASSIPSIPSYPSIPSVPSVPSVPSIPSVPSVPSVPSIPSVPSVPSYPSIPSVPSVPSVPSIPSVPSVPSYPSIPSVPSVPSYPSAPSIPSYPSIPSVPSYPGQRRPFFPLRGGAYKDIDEHGQGYAPFVKDRYIVKGKKKYREKFLRMGKGVFSEADAHALGAHLVDQSAAASFMVKPVTGTPQPLKHKISPWSILGGKFYPKDNILIESTMFRIDSPGEHEGITAKGILANMQRAKPKRQPPRKQLRDTLMEPFILDDSFPKMSKVDSFQGWDMEKQFNKMLKVKSFGF